MSEESKPQSNGWADWFRITIAGWISLLVGISLLVLGGIVGLAFHTRTERISWGEYLSWSQIGLLACLWLSICVTSYWLVRLALSELPASDKSFSEAWKSGLDTISRRGIRIGDVPIFVVLGCEDFPSQQSFMRQIGMSVSVPPCPEQPSAPIRWFVSDDRIVIACQTVGGYALAQSRLELHLKKLQEEMPFHDESLSPEPFAVETPESLDGSVGSPAVIAGSESLDTPWFDANAKSDGPNLIPFPSRNESEAFRGGADDILEWTPSDGEKQQPVFSPWVDRLDSTPHSLVAQKSNSISEPLVNNETKENGLLNQLDRTEELVALVQEQTFGAIASSEHPSLKTMIAPRLSSSRPLLSSSELIHSQAALGDLCDHLVNTRGDVAPINGIIVRVDAVGLIHCKRLAGQYGQSLRQDIEQMQRQLGVHVPISIVLDNLHQFESFQQLIRRLGPNMAGGISLGELFGTQRAVTATNLSVACARLMRSIHRAVNHVFRTPEGKLRPLNHRVFPLLSLCRGDLKESLSDFLLQSLTVPDAAGIGAEPMFLQSIYVMGSGTTETQRGFGSFILRNMFEENDRLAWTSARLEREARYKTRVVCLQAVSVLLLCTATALFWLRIR